MIIIFDSDKQHSIHFFGKPGSWDNDEFSVLPVCFMALCKCFVCVAVIISREGVNPIVFSK